LLACIDIAAIDLKGKPVNFELRHDKQPKKYHRSSPKHDHSFPTVISFGLVLGKKPVHDGDMSIIYDHLVPPFRALKFVSLDFYVVLLLFEEFFQRFAQLVAGVDGDPQDFRFLEDIEGLIGLHAIF
jgi:hypothetical protein